MRSLWLIAGICVLGGLALVIASVTAGIGPIGLIAGILLLWSGIVKVIVLRIWRATIHVQPATDRWQMTTDAANSGRHLP